MATAHHDGRFLELDTVRAWYDAKSDSFRITCADTDLGPSGINLSVKQDSIAERALKTAMARAGLPTQPELNVSEQPASFVLADRPENITPLSWQLGSYTDASPAWIQLDRHTPHVLLSGRSGAGKTEQIKRLIATAGAHSIAEVMVLDSVGSLLTHCQDHHATHVSIDASMQPGIDAIAEALGEVNRRIDILAQAGLASTEAATQQAVEELPGAASDHPLFMPPMLLIIDAVDDLLGEHYVAEQVQDTFGQLVRKAATVDAHLVLACTDATSRIISASMRQRLLSVGLSTRSAEASVVAIGRPGLERLHGPYGVIEGDSRIFRTYGQEASA